jgi:C-terminal processing protease CtpA/Prc
MSLVDRDYDEKRNFIRMQVNTSVSLELSGQQLSGWCIDLSGGGLQVEMEEALPLETELEVTITSPHGHSPMLQAKTRVARVTEGDNGKKLVGMEIIEVLNGGQ